MRRAFAIVVVLASACSRSDPPTVVAVPPLAFADAGPPRTSGGPPPAAGGACARNPEQAEVCVDAKSALACQKNVWVTLACGGPRGCAPGANSDVCDQSLADPQATCNADDDYACTHARKEMLHCAASRWVVVQRCDGARGCSVNGKKITCDNSVASAGDACREEDDFACAADGASALRCSGGRFVLASLCRGPNACRVNGSQEAGFKVACDDSRARVDDVCTKNDNFSCAEDGHALLRCKGGRFVIEDRCKSKERCMIKNSQIGCY